MILTLLLEIWRLAGQSKMKTSTLASRLAWVTILLLGFHVGISPKSNAVTVYGGFVRIVARACTGSVLTCTGSTAPGLQHMRLRYVACTWTGSAYVKKITISAHESNTSPAYQSITRYLSGDEADGKTFNSSIYDQFGMPIAPNTLLRIELEANQSGTISFKCSLAGENPQV